MHGRRIVPGAWANGLWINAGAALAMGTELHGRRSHKGMAALVELDGKRARFWLKMMYLTYPPPAAPAPGVPGGAAAAPGQKPGVPAKGAPP